MDRKMNPKDEKGDYRKVKVIIQSLEKGEDMFRCTIPRPDNKSIPYPIHVECGKEVEIPHMCIQIARDSYYPHVKVEQEEGGQKRAVPVKQRRYSVEILEDNNNDVSGAKRSKSQSS